MTGRARAVAIVALLALSTTAGCGGGTPQQPAPTGTGWVEGQVSGRWTLVFAGYGPASHDGDVVRLDPTVAADHDVTHGALAVDTAAPADLRLTGTVTTVEQHRPGTPNPWEVGWFLWRYSDPDHFYALALKPNGWELSKQDPAYPGKQRFLASGSTPAYPVGTSHEVEIVAVGSTTTVRVDGSALATVTDEERPYLTGGIGLYTEDARVDFRGVHAEQATRLPDWALPPVPARRGTGPGGGAVENTQGSTS